LFVGVFVNRKDNHIDIIAKGNRKKVRVSTDAPGFIPTSILSQ
jgi:hypothetical protein